MNYGNLAHAAPASACCEEPSRVYRSRPAPAECPPSPAPIPSRSVAVVALHPREQAVRRADALALSLCAAHGTLSVPLTRVAATIVATGAWNAFGFARVNDFARERLGRSGRWLRDLAALHDRMLALPGLEAALTGADGARPIGRVSALAIGRIASPASVREWTALARRFSVRELREEVRRSRSAGSDSPQPATGADGVNDDSERRFDAPSSDSAAAGAGPSSPSPSGAASHDDDPADRSLVRIDVPLYVHAAFDEAVDLYRAVEGREATVTSFVEALVAECAAGGDPPDADRAPLRPGPGLALIENALARSTDRWDQLPVGAGLPGALAAARETLRRIAAITRGAGAGGPSDLLDQMRTLVGIENDIETRLGTLLAGMTADQAWSRLRFSGVGHYAEERLGVSRTAAEDRVRAARALRRYPRLRQAYESDRLGLEAVLIVARILDAAPPGESFPAAEAAWVARAREATVKRLRDEARLLGRRAAEGEPAAEGERSYHPPADADWHASLRRAPGTARRRVLRMGLRAAGLGCEPGGDPEKSFLHDPDTAVLPASDVFLRLRLPADLAGLFMATIETHRRRLGDEAGLIPWDAPWPVNEGPLPLPSLLAARMFSTRCRRIPAWVGLLAAIEEFVLTWDSDASRAPTSRDRVFVRDGWRCAAPGCSSRRHLEDHHVVYRSRGGGDGGANRICLCRFHHQRGEHGGLASCSGEAPLGITWRLGRRDLAVWYRNERRFEKPRAPGLL
jgi:hypothetical protein